MQTCTIGLSINENLKLRKRKGKRETGNITSVYKYQQRAAKALIVSEPIVMWQNLAKFGKMLCDSKSIKFYYSFSPFSTCAVTLPPPLIKPALKLYSLYYAHKVFLSVMGHSHDTLYTPPQYLQHPICNIRNVCNICNNIRNVCNIHNNIRNNCNICRFCPMRLLI